RSNCTTRVLIFEHERLSREPKGKGRELLQILISRDFETGELRLTRAAGSGACFGSGRSRGVFERRIIQAWASPRIDPLLRTLTDYACLGEAVSLYEHESRRRGVLDWKN